MKSDLIVSKHIYPRWRWFDRAQAYLPETEGGLILLKHIYLSGGLIVLKHIYPRRSWFDRTQVYLREMESGLIVPKRQGALIVSKQYLPEMEVVWSCQNISARDGEWSDRAQVHLPEMKGSMIVSKYTYPRWRVV